MAGRTIIVMTQREADEYGVKDGEEVFGKTRKGEVYVKYLVCVGDADTSEVPATEVG